MIRNAAAVLFAILLGNVAIFFGEALNWTLFPPAAAVDFSDAEAVKAMVAAMPAAAYVGVATSYLLGSALAGAVVAKVATSRHLALAAGVGVVFTVANTLNLVAIPHPLWFAVLTTVIFVPTTVGVTRLLLR